MHRWFEVFTLLQTSTFLVNMFTLISTWLIKIILHYKDLQHLKTFFTYWQHYVFSISGEYLWDSLLFASRMTFPMRWHIKVLKRKEGKSSFCFPFDMLSRGEMSFICLWAFSNPEAWQCQWHTYIIDMPLRKKRTNYLLSDELCFISMRNILSNPSLFVFLFLFSLQIN